MSSEFTGGAFDALMASSRSTYEFSTRKLPDGRPLVVDIERIPLMDATLAGVIPFSVVGGKDMAQDQDSPAARARARALATAEVHAGVDGGVDVPGPQFLEYVRDRIDIIDRGCPELRGRIKPLGTDCRLDPDGRRLDLVWTDLGVDFFLLVKAIMELSDVGGAAETAATFRAKEPRGGRGAAPGGHKVRRVAQR